MEYWLRLPGPYLRKTNPTANPTNTPIRRHPMVAITHQYQIDPEDEGLCDSVPFFDMEILADIELDRLEEVVTDALGELEEPNEREAVADWLVDGLGDMVEFTDLLAVADRDTDVEPDMEGVKLLEGEVDLVGDMVEFTDLLAVGDRETDDVIDVDGETDPL